MKNTRKLRQNMLLVMVVKYCCRGGATEVFVGDWKPKRIVMLKFPSRENYDAFMADPDYKQWKELRESLTTIKQWLVVDGV